MAINEILIDTSVAAAGGDSDPNILLDLNASDVDSYDGDGDVWYDIHDFEYKPTTNVAQNFNTVLYPGTGIAKPITGVGFAPDLVWIKKRNGSTFSSHMLFDTVRGVDNVIRTDSNAAEYQGGGTGYQTSFNTDGFSITGNTFVNNSSNTFVAWCFKAGGAPSGTDTVSINGTSYADEAAAGLTAGTAAVIGLSANNDLGFSVVQYNGANTAVTVAHGLDVPPEMVISKPLVTGAWAVFHKDMASDLDKNYIPLTTAGVTSNASSLWNYSNWGTTKIGSSNPLMFGTNNDVINYCFASKRGVSKVGSFTGTGAAGNKIYTGFEPAFILTKRTSTSGASWSIIDNKRSTDSDKNDYLAANTTGGETTSSSGVTFNRDGFTFNGASFNTSGAQHIYYAVAKNTNETSLIAPGTNLKLGLDAGTYNGSGNWLDSSGNSNDGTITGATWEQELGNFFDFDGSSDYVSISANASFNSATAFTVEQWVNPDVVGALDHFSSIYDQQTFSGRKYLLRFSDTSGNLISYTYDSSGTVDKTLVTTSAPISAGNWYHVVMTYDNGAGQAIYVNGEREAFSPFTNGAINTANVSDLYIGAINDFLGTYDFNGKMGQFRMYSSALSIDDIRQNYNFTKPRYPNEFHGAITGASFVPAAGGEVDHFDFNGTSSNYINIPTPRFLTGDFTISIWANFDSLSGQIKMLFGGSHYSSSAGSLGHYINGSGLATWITNASGGASNIISTSGNFVINTWYNIMLVREGSTITAYVGNSSVGTGTYFGDLSSPITRLGNHYNSTSYPFDGSVSKVKIYNKALTLAERTALYNEGR